MNIESGFDLQDLLAMLKRRAALIGAVAGAVFLVAYWVAMALPNVYESYATLLVEPQSVNERLVEPGAAGTDLNARLHLMTAQILSRPRLSRLIDELELYKEESEELTREEVIDLMRNDVRVEPILPELQVEDNSRQPIEINTFRVYFRADTPRQAAQVAQRLANDFIEEHIGARVRLTQKSLEFIDSEQQRLSARIAEVEQQIAQLKAANPGRLPEDFAANQRLYERSLSELRDAQRALDLARSDEAFWSNQAVATMAVEPWSRADTNPAQRLQQLELLLAELRAKGFTEKHPDVLKTEAEIERVRAHVENLEQEGEAEEAGEEPAPSFAQQSAEAERRRAALRVAAAEEEITRLRQQVDEILQRLAETPRVAEQLEALRRQHDSLRTSLADFSSRQLQATVQASLERRQLGEQFRVLESAFPPPAPASPNRPLILVLGLLLGLAMGGGAAILVESTSSSVHGARELQTALSLPVLAAIPEILLESDRVLRRRRRLRVALATAALALVCLVGGAATYVYVNGAPAWLRSDDASAPVGVLPVREEGTA